MSIDLPEKTSVKIFVSHVNSHHRVTTPGKDFNNQVDGVPHSVDTIRTLSPDILSVIA